MVSANTVAQNPSGSLSPPLSPAHPADDAVDEALAVLSAVLLSDFTHAANARSVAMPANDWAAILFFP
jgi:hypothetical protein